MRTRGPASPSAILTVELARDSRYFSLDIFHVYFIIIFFSLTAVNEFDKTSLKPAETAEKNPLPSSKDIEQEMEHIKFKVRYLLH